MICANPKCRRQVDPREGLGGSLTRSDWAGAYCSRACFRATLRKGEHIRDMLHDPTDPTGRRTIARNADEIDAMMEAHGIDARLPRIIYWRKRGLTYRAVAARCGVDASTCNRILALATPKLLRECGLRKI